MTGLRKNRIISMLLVIMLLLTAPVLTGCGGAEKQEAVPSSAPSAEPQAEESGERIWQTEFIPVADESLTAGLTNGTVTDGKLTFTSVGVLADETPEGVTPEWEEQYWRYGPVLCRVGTDGTVETIPYSPEESGDEETTEGGVLFEKLYAAADGTLWLIENHYTAGQTAEKKVLVHLGGDGSRLGSLPLDQLEMDMGATNTEGAQHSMQIAGMAEAGDGDLCLAVHEWYSGNGGYLQSNRIIILNGETGEQKKTVEVSGELAGLARSGDGRIAAARYQGATPVVGILDPEAGTVEEVAQVGDFLTGMTEGRRENSVCLAAGDSLYELDLDSGETEKILNWTDCDVSRSGDESICLLEDGRIVTTTGEQTAAGMKNELVVLTSVPATQAEEKKVLRMAVYNLYPFTTAMVSRFNRSSTEYRIEVKDYSQYNDYTSGNEEDWNAGITRLQTELIAGDVPDILDISLLSASRLGAKGLLEDLYPYIDADPELGREKLNQHVLEAFEEHGRLYQTVGNYYVLTTAGLSSAVGENMGWTMEQFSQAMERLREEHPESTVFDLAMTRDEILTFLLYLDMENYVDWETGECRFDSESFREFLEFVGSFPTAYDWEGGMPTATDLDQDTRLRMGLQLMKMCNFARFEDMQVNTLGLAGEKCTFIGYPTEEGVGSMFAQIGNVLAISSGCAYKDAAWQFVRQFFLPAYQEQFVGSVFPTNLEVYEEMKREAVSGQYERNPDGSYRLDNDGKRIPADRGSVTSGGVSLPLQAVTEEEIEAIEEIIARTDHVLTVDNSLRGIIAEGAAGYLADQRSVDDAATQIQSRANLYVNEQR